MTQLRCCKPLFWPIVTSCSVTHVLQLQVLQALESVATILQDEFKDPPNNNSMRNLGAYLTLAHVSSGSGRDRNKSVIVTACRQLPGAAPQQL
jgi:hypothetical protein